MNLFRVLIFTFVFCHFAHAENVNVDCNYRYRDFPTQEAGLLNWIEINTKIAVNAENVVERTDRASQALLSTLKGPDGVGIKYFIKKSDCMAWINLYRGSLLGGFRLGRGLASCRVSPDSNEWSAPFYVRMGELSAGVQLGVDQSDYFLFFPDKKTLLNILGGNLKLDGNIALTAAKWGRSVSVGTDVDLIDTEIKKDVVYSYAFSRGVYAGLSLEGGFLLAEPQYNEKAYSKLKTEEVLALPNSKAPEATRSYSKILNELNTVP